MLVRLVRLVARVVLMNRARYRSWTTVSPHHSLQLFDCKARNYFATDISLIGKDDLVQPFFKAQNAQKITLSPEQISKYIIEFPFIHTKMLNLDSQNGQIKDESVKDYLAFCVLKMDKKCSTGLFQKIYKILLPKGRFSERISSRMLFKKYFDRRLSKFIAELKSEKTSSLRKRYIWQVLYQFYDQNESAYLFGEIQEPKMFLRSLFNAVAYELIVLTQMNQFKEQGILRIKAALECKDEEMQYYLARLLSIDQNFKLMFPSSLKIQVQAIIEKIDKEKTVLSVPSGQAPQMKRKPRIRKSSTKKLFTELHMPKNILKSKYISTKLSKNRSPSVFEKVSQCQYKQFLANKMRRPSLLYQLLKKILYQIKRISKQFVITLLSQQSLQMLKKYYSCPEVIGRALIIFINVCNFDKAKEIMMSEEDKRKLFTNYYSRLLELCRKDKNDDSYKIKQQYFQIVVMCTQRMFRFNIIHQEKFPDIFDINNLPLNTLSIYLLQEYFRLLRFAICQNDVKLKMVDYLFPKIIQILKNPKVTIKFLRRLIRLLKEINYTKDKSIYDLYEKALCNCSAMQVSQNSSFPLIKEELVSLKTGICDRGYGSQQLHEFLYNSLQNLDRCHEYYKQFSLSVFQKALKTEQKIREQLSS